MVCPSLTAWRQYKKHSNNVPDYNLKMHTKIELENLERLLSAQSRLGKLLVKTSGRFHLKHRAA